MPISGTTTGTGAREAMRGTQIAMGGASGWEDPGLLCLYQFAGHHDWSAGGKPHVARRRITVQNIVIWHEFMGHSADEIATEYDLSLADVYAAF